LVGGGSPPNVKPRKWSWEKKTKREGLLKWGVDEKMTLKRLG